MIRVLIAEDMHMVRGALVALLKLERDIDVVAEVHSGDAIVPAALAERPDVAVIDIVLPGVDGLTAAAELRDRLPSCRVLVLTGVGRPGNLRRALAAKVSGFIVKDAPPEQLAEAIRKVAAGLRVIDPQLAVAALESEYGPLSDRELEVLRLAAEGIESDEIAARLNLSPGTVRNYLTAIVAKLGARNRLHAVRIAEHAGWL
ncbi:MULTISPECIES: response regulator transcription factor [Actinomadura]|uniref:DNA-binding response regulator n=1 Tax=Actinomadura yumaensis TaxID=111807 RepID=A0ABW2CCJ8_9ACTN|nr:response regulator transcription factor [Actinomadura sp. J1-007]MWK35552.1 response regulator [Actinomadura sp. J1-007]